MDRVIIRGNCVNLAISPPKFVTLEQGVSMNTKDNTALIEASYHDQAAVAELISDNNASVNIQNNEGKTALMITAVYGNFTVCDLLIQHNTSIDLNMRHIIMGKASYSWLMNIDTARYPSCYYNIPKLELKHSVTIFMTSL